MKNSTPRPCPCGSPTSYLKCCQIWHQGKVPPLAEQLMRSRYSAYVLDQLDYLAHSWHPSTRPAALSPNPAKLKWLGLQIRRQQAISPTEHLVEFVARSRFEGQPQRMHEISRFIWENDRWWYVDGTFPEEA